MSTQFTEKPGTTKEQYAGQPGYHRDGEHLASRRFASYGTGRLVYVVGAVAALVAIIGILLFTILPTMAPQGLTSATMPSSNIGTASDKTGNRVATASTSVSMPSSNIGTATDKTGNPVLSTPTICFQGEPSNEHCEAAQEQTFGIGE